MRVERLLQLSIAVLVSLSTLLLGMGERNLTLPVVAVIVSASSLYLTDIKGWLQLNTTVTNLAGLAALGATWRDWDYGGGESQLLSMANLLIYLQFVLLYRKKDHRIYWLLILLSLLQVAVASALSMSIFFGFVLLIYMFVGLITLAMFSMYRELHFNQLSWLPWQRQEMAKAAAAAPQRRWPLAAEAPRFAGRPDEGDVDSGLTWGWVRQILQLGIMTLIFSCLLFFGLPRVGKGARWRTGHGRELRTVGFSESVTLGELGEAYQNDNALLQAYFYEGESDEPYRVAGDAPLFRGALLTSYQNGQWNRSLRRHSHTHELPMSRPGDLPVDAQLVRQKIKLQPRADDTLFSVFPIYQLHEEDPDLLYSRNHEQLYRPGEKRGRDFEYELYTTGFRDHLYSMVIPAPRLPGQYEFVNELLQVPEDVDGYDTLSGLKSVATQLVDDVAPLDRERRARILEMHLRDITRFRYSLKAVERDPKLDPIEDFITKHPIGHCEYFASALTLMLRSVGIPARMAIGFKGGEWNDVGKYYQVRELHAHAWVEAYMSADHLPNAVKNSPLAMKNGAWLILDPTPAGDEGDQYDFFGLSSWKQLIDLSQFLWSNYVLGMDSQRQQEAIYQPLVKRIEDQLRQLGDEEYRQQLRDKINEKLGGQRFGLSQGWFSWQGLLVVATSLLVGAVSFRGGQRAARPVRRWFARRFDRTQRRYYRKIRFYERFEELLAEYRLQRPPNQTPREFALAVGGQFAESHATQHAAALPRRIVEAFYRVRFGARDLDNLESQAVEQAISELAAALKAAASKTSRSA